MQKFVLIFFVFFNLQFFSQKQYQFPEYFNPVYNFKPELAHKEFIKDLDPKKNNTSVEKYIVTNLYAEQYKFDNNSVYLDWDVSRYLKRILDSILPESKEKSNIDIFISRSWDNDAYINRFGNMYINIGMINEAKDEAALAHLIAHVYSHYLYKHAISENKLFKYEEGNYRDLGEFMQLENKFSKLHQKSEEEAELFAFKRLNEKSIGITPLICFKHFGLSEKISQSGIDYLYMIDTSSTNVNIKKVTSTAKPQVDSLYLLIKDNAASRHFFIDSTYFFKLKKIAKEECKKIAFEECNYGIVLRYGFIDYLKDPKNMKNLYLIVESIRRKMYKDVKIKEKGFLAENIFDPKIYDYNKSILYKPEYCFINYSQYYEVKDHNFFTSKSKPFNTYEQAFIYFADEAIKLGLNEANFSKGLYYFSENKTDSTKKYLSEYQKKNGLYSDLAKDILLKGKPEISNGKIFILYDNIINYTADDMNYYLALKRKKDNGVVKMAFENDSSKVKLLIMNEILGNKPNELNQMQKIINCLNTLFDKDDSRVCKKTKLSSKVDIENKNIATRFRKNFVIYAPEFYQWFKENNFNRLFYIKEFYDYDGYLKEEEFANNYLGCYIDVNQDRPYFKIPYRSNLERKDSESNIRKELLSFLYE